MEMDALERYLKNKGRLFIMLDARSQSGLETFLRHWGVQADDDLAMSKAGVLLGTELLNVNAVGTDYAPHPITAKLADTNTEFPYARSIRRVQQPEGGTADQPRVTGLVKTGAEYWGETNPDTEHAGFNPATDIAGPLPLAVAVETSKPQGVDVDIGVTRMVVVGTSRFVDNSDLAGGNLDFFMNSLNWLLQREQSVAVSPKTPEEFRLDMSPNQQMTVYILVMGGMPLAVAIIGLMVWLGRSEMTALDDRRHRAIPPMAKALVWKPRTTLALVLIALVLGGFVAVDYYRGTSTDKAQTKSQRVLDFQSKEISAVTIELTNQTYALERSGDQWQIKQPLNVRANYSTVSSILDELEFAERSRTITSKELKGAASEGFGLQHPRIRLTLQGKKQPVVLLVGNETPTKDAVYVQAQGSGNVLIAPKSIYDRLNRSLDDLRDRTVIDFLPASATRIEIKSADRDIELAKSSAATNTEPRWVLTRPVAARADQRKTSELLADLNELRVADFVSEDPRDVHTYQLDEP